jgi:hypothetical protein
VRVPNASTDGTQEQCSDGRTDEPAEIHTATMMTLSYDDIITPC